MGDSTIACDFSDSDLKPIYYLIESAARRLLTPDSLRVSVHVGVFSNHDLIQRCIHGKTFGATTLTKVL